MGIVVMVSVLVVAILASSLTGEKNASASQARRERKEREGIL